MELKEDVVVWWRIYPNFAATLDPEAKNGV